MKKVRGIFIKNQNEIALLREANRIVSLVLDEIGANVAPGITTLELEKQAIGLCEKYNVIPAFKGYNGFPFALCCSVNEEVVHGFPSERVLQEGDVVSVDFGVQYKGFFGDSARTFPVGEIDEKVVQLLSVTEKSLYKGIAQAVAGNELYDISEAIETYVSEFGFGVVERFVGHGIGRKLHEKPEVPNFVPQGGSKIPLCSGMALAIEPMITLGSPDVCVLDDGWTAVTKDGSIAAHFEHTIVITGDGPEILSISKR